MIKNRAIAAKRPLGIDLQTAFVGTSNYEIVKFHTEEESQGNIQKNPIQFYSKDAMLSHIKRYSHFRDYSVKIDGTTLYSDGSFTEDGKVFFGIE